MFVFLMNMLPRRFGGASIHSHQHTSGVDKVSPSSTAASVCFFAWLLEVIQKHARKHTHHAPHTPHTPHPLHTLHTLAHVHQLHTYSLPCWIFFRIRYSLAFSCFGIACRVILKTKGPLGLTKGFLAYGSLLHFVVIVIFWFLAYISPLIFLSATD